nr:PREDICTED: uncharacterized protein LOC107983244 [Anolis carolinensis]|eukprot:XP_016851434.1 PREDICTED: uncharacterized protein LOC107983244 [Anolis carolinensis]
MPPLGRSPLRTATQHSFLSFFSLHFSFLLPHCTCLSVLLPHPAHAFLSISLTPFFPPPSLCVPFPASLSPHMHLSLCLPHHAYIFLSFSPAPCLSFLLPRCAHLFLCLPHHTHTFLSFSLAPDAPFPPSPLPQKPSLSQQSNAAGLLCQERSRGLHLPSPSHFLPCHLSFSPLFQHLFPTPVFPFSTFPFPTTVFNIPSPSFFSSLSTLAFPRFQPLFAISGSSLFPPVSQPLFLTPVFPNFPALSNLNLSHFSTCLFPLQSFHFSSPLLHPSLAHFAIFLSPSQSFPAALLSHPNFPSVSQ